MTDSKAGNKRLVRLGPKNGQWKGGRRILRSGYVVIYMPSYHRLTQRYYVFEHIYVMEQHLGRWLKPDEIVHHINGDRQNNRIENLTLFENHSQHMGMHNDTRRVDHTNTVCFWCGGRSVHGRKWYLHNNVYICNACYHKKEHHPALNSS